MATDRLARITDHLQRQYIETGRIAGCQTLVARHGEVLHFVSLGLMDRERARPVRDDTIWRIYSMTKPITSIALMMLYEEGRFALNDAVHKFIPAWRGQRVWESGSGDAMRTRAPQRPMTMRHLLNHSAGLTYGGELLPEGSSLHPVDEVYRGLNIDLSGDDTLDTLVDKLARVPLRYDPGEHWEYSLATDVCGWLVQRLSGQPFEQFVQQRILDPLRMVDTAFSIAPDKLDRFAACYRREASKAVTLVDDPLASSYAQAPALHSGGGGLVGTTADYLRFCEMLRRGGELDRERLIGPRTLALMRMNHLPGGGDLARVALDSFSESAFEGVGFGLGFATTLGEVQAGVMGAGDFYWGGMASTMFWVDPKEDLVVIFMTQLVPSSSFNLRGQLKNLVYAALVD